MTEAARALYSVSQLFPTRKLRFFLTAPQPCPYLPGRSERKVFTHLPLNEGALVNDSLTLGGFRRSQNIAYRPACTECDACVSARIPAARYVFSRSERRTLERNANLVRGRRPARATREQFDLLQHYLTSRHASGGMAGMGWSDYISMVEDTATRTHIMEYREPSPDSSDDRLVACVLVDVLADGLSLVYSFYDTTRPKRSLGSFIILDHVKQATETLTDHVYLGYWVQGSDKMAYKARFDPIEILHPEGWRLMRPEERRNAAPST